MQAHFSAGSGGELRRGDRAWSSGHVVPSWISQESSWTPIDASCASVTTHRIAGADIRVIPALALLSFARHRRGDGSQDADARVLPIRERVGGLSQQYQGTEHVSVPAPGCGARTLCRVLLRSPPPGIHRISRAARRGSLSVETEARRECGERSVGPISVAGTTGTEAQIRRARFP